MVDPRSRARALAVALDAVVDGEIGCWLEAPHVTSDAAWDDGLRVLMTVLASRWTAAVTIADATSEPPPDDVAGSWLLAAATAWASSGDPSPTADRVLERLAGLPDPDLGDPLEQIGAHLAVEATLAHGRLDLAAALVDRWGPALWSDLVLDGHPHGFSHMMRCFRIRVLAFRADITGALAVLEDVPPPPDGPIRAVVAATGCLVRGNDAHPADVRRLVAEIDLHAPTAEGHLLAGSQMLAAFGLIAIGDVVGAARRVLVAGGDADLSRLNVVDRAMALEMLVALAAADGDLDAASAWADRAVPLLAAPSADSTVARINSRVALLADRPAEAVAWAERAVARASETERLIEYAEGEIVLNRARIHQRGTTDRAAAVHALEAMVAQAEAHGHRSARRAAVRELRPLGLRLRPMAGSGWAGLSAREAEVARAVAVGSTNRQIAARLHVSEHTVRAHVSRVLAAFAVATRSGLPAALGLAEAETCTRPALTRRQVEVAELVGQGLGNAAIAARLGVSVRTVEKHVGDILTRWDLGGRTAIARVVTNQPARTRAEEPVSLA